MKCGKCGREIGIAKVCPSCGEKISYGGNTKFFSDAYRYNISLGDIFTDVFKKRKPGDVEKVFRRAPLNDAEMLSQWQKPWFFIRVFAVLVVTTLLLMYLSGLAFGAQIIFYAGIVPTYFIGCMVIPVTILFFIWEMDVPRGVAMYEVVLLMICGGTLSLILGGYGNELLLPSDHPAYYAGFTEEPAKLIVAAVFIALRKKRYYLLDGLVIGAAIGAGFDFMETSGYILGSGFNVDYLIMRSVSPLGGHILFCAPYVAALCWAMNGKRFKAVNLLDVRFIAFFVLGILIHMFQNLDIYMGMIGYVPITSVIVSIIGWAAIFYLIKQGLKQVVRVSGDAMRAPFYESAREKSAVKAEITGITGAWRGRSVNLSDAAVLRIGRDTLNCNIVIPKDDVAVSRMHCELRLINGQIVLRDKGSTRGTFLDGGRKLTAESDTILHSGDRFYLADKNNMFEVRL